jgi:hypothetical protein
MVTAERYSPFFSLSTIQSVLLKTKQELKCCVLLEVIQCEGNEKKHGGLPAILG